MIKTSALTDNSSARPTTRRGARLARITALGLLAGGLLGIGAVTAPARAVASTPPCLTFAGLQHCPVGGATLQLPPGGDRIEVNNPNQAIGAGVAIALPDATSWRGTLLPLFSAGTTPVLQSSALSDGVVTSRSEARKIGTKVAFSASFTGSVQDRKFTAHVYRGGVLVGSVPHIPSDTPGGWAASTILVQMLIEFVVAPAGQCEWLYSFTSDQNIQLPDGRVLIGNELRLVEEVNPSGGYAYTSFDGLIFQGTFFRTDIKGESVGY